MSWPSAPTALDAISKLAESHIDLPNGDKIGQDRRRTFPFLTSNDAQLHNGTTRLLWRSFWLDVNISSSEDGLELVHNR